MKLERLLAIVMTLLSRRRVHAKELAEMYEVSVRTIYRDIEAINMAGIPVVTYQGHQGGIGLDDRYRLDKNWLSGEELSSIVTALKSLQSSHYDPQAQTALQKIQATYAAAMSSRPNEADLMYVDLSGWGAEDTTKRKIALLKGAAAASQIVTFTYNNVQGECASREAEPHTLVLKGQKWYLYAYDVHKQAFRLFKLGRMADIRLTGTSFARRDVRLEQLPWISEWHQPGTSVTVRLKFRPDLRHLLYEWFDAEQIRRGEDGCWIVEATYPEDPWVYGFILSFGARVEVLAPERLRRIIRGISENIAGMYRDDIPPGAEPT